MYHEQPATGARVSLVPLDRTSTARPQGTVGADGGFELSTYELHDGVPTGRYTVMITWPGPNPRSNGKGDEELQGPDRLAGRYSNPNASAWEVEVRAEPLEIEPFILD